MTITDIIDRAVPPEPWEEGDNIPWDDPDFSRRMLDLHLSQDHDWASRRTERIDEHVRWIHETLLGGTSSRVLDLGCGPGLYLQRLAELGHSCRGIDFSPASIDYARSQAETYGRDIEYIQGDMRTADFDEGFDLVMQIFGEINVFSESDAEVILRKAAAALNDDGTLLLEVHRTEVLRKNGETGPSWTSEESGLFSDSPHLSLRESFWDEDRQAATVRFFIIDEQGAVTRSSVSYQAYSDEQFAALLTRCGFAQIEFRAWDEDEPDFIIVAARKPVSTA